MKREFTFYEFVGVIAPGSVLLLGLQYCLPSVANLLGKSEFSLGDLGVFVILAYVLGHLIQSVGNLLEWLWWKPFKGMPSLWVQKDDCSYLDASQVAALPEKLSAILGFKVRSPQDYEPGKWFALSRQVAAALHQRKVADRLETFNGNYGLFRGIAASLLVTITLLLICKGCGAWKEGLVGVLLLAMAIARMHRFGRYYARELYVQALQLSPDKKTEKSTKEDKNV